MRCRHPPSIIQAKIFISAIFTHIDPKSGAQVSKINKPISSMIFISQDHRILPQCCVGTACVNQTKMFISAIFRRIDPERGQKDSKSNKSRSGIFSSSCDRRILPILPIDAQKSLGGAMKIRYEECNVSYKITRDVLRLELEFGGTTICMPPAIFVPQKLLRSSIGT